MDNNLSKIFGPSTPNTLWPVIFHFNSPIKSPNITVSPEHVDLSLAQNGLKDYSINELFKEGITGDRRRAKKVKPIVTNGAVITDAPKFV